MAEWHERRLEDSTPHRRHVYDTFSIEDDHTVLSNGHYVKSLVEVILLCAKQNVSLRGHDESEDSLNPGNLRGVTDLLSKHDKDLRRRMEMLPAYARLRSNERLID